MAEALARGVSRAGRGGHWTGGRWLEMRAMWRSADGRRYSLTHFVLDRFLTKVMTSTTTTPSTGSTAAQENVKRKSNDPGWEYAVCVNPKKLERVKCILCNKRWRGDQ
ncbi:unnamed protein product [Lactuca virosa]|uniref:Uncharacterized protein n=1 Tax=Lactuca virosa TaxID=75947 RepID=A0AAU9PSW7_9ASTR|nr:unnamed protein product [Lactuca virosa]